MYKAFTRYKKQICESMVCVSLDHRLTNLLIYESMVHVSMKDTTETQTQTMTQDGECDTKREGWQEDTILHYSFPDWLLHCFISS